MEESPAAPQMFGNAAVSTWSATDRRRALRLDRYKNHKHSVNNPFAQFQDRVHAAGDQGLPHDPRPAHEACSARPRPTVRACAIVASERFVDEHGLWRAVEIAGQAVVTDLPSTFAGTNSSITICGADMTKSAALAACEEAQVAVQDVDVIELHDCFSANELITYEALGLAEEGRGHELVEREATTYGGEGPWSTRPAA